MKKRKINYFVDNIVSKIFIASFFVLGIFILVIQLSVAKATEDNTAPVIDPVDGVEIYTEDVPEPTWTAPTASANDDVDGNISGQIDVEYYKADGTTLLGGYNIQRTASKELKAGRNVVVKYNVSDTAGNAAEEIWATFTAIDNSAPIITSNHWFYKENYDLIANENIIEYKINDNGWIKTSEPTQIVPLTLDLGSKKDIKVYKINVKDVKGNASTEPFILKYKTAEELDNKNPEIKLEGYEGNDIIIGIALDDTSSWIPPVSKVRDNMDFDIVATVSYYKAVGDGDTSLADLDAARKELAAGRDVVVKYNARDDAGNEAEEVKVTVTTRDIILPEIEQVQGAEVKIEDVATWTAPTAKGTDNIDADFTVEGQYHKTDGTTIDLVIARKELEAERDVVVKYNATDNAGNEAEEVKAIFTAKDNTAPVIIIAGVEVNTEDASDWIAPDATVTDNVNTGLTATATYFKAGGTTSIELTGARTELTKGRDVIVKYNTVDVAGNIADEVEATFTANDNTAPVIEPVDGAEVSKEQSASWTAPQTTASDNVDGILTGSIKVTYFKADGTTVLASLTYARQELAVGRRALVKYNVSDAAGNVADEVKVTFIPDNEAPVIVPVNGGSVNIENASSWTAPKATATDEGVDISERIVVTYYKADGSKLLDEETARTELVAGRSIALKYNVSDEAGNDAYEVEATFKADNEAPVILSVDGRFLNIENALNWTAPKAIAVDGTVNINERIVVTYYKADDVDAAIGLAAAITELKAERNVVVKYNVSDEAGNEAVEVIAIFEADNTEPVIDQNNLIVGGPVSIVVNPNWTAPTPTAIDGPFNIIDRLVIKYYTEDGSRELTGEAIEAREELKAERSVLVKYNLSDEAGNPADEVSAIFEADNKAPVINQVDDADVNTEDASKWIVPSTTATDDAVDISKRIVVTYYKANGWWELFDGETGAKNELYHGKSIVVKYNVSDEAGNEAEEVSATVTAKDNTAPEIVLEGHETHDWDNSLDIVGIYNVSTWTAPTAKVIDNVDTGLTTTAAYFKADGTTSIDLIAARKELTNGNSILITYTVVDAEANKTVVSATVTAKDTTAPVITVPTALTINAEDIATWVAPDTTATDDVDGLITEGIDIKYFNADETSEFTTMAEVVAELKAGNDVVVKYIVSDVAGNEASITATFTPLADTTAPIVTSVDTDEDGNLTSEKRTTSNTYTLEANEELIEYRVYLEGDTPPEFTTALTPSTIITDILYEVVDGIYVIEVKDKAANTTSIKVYVGVNSAVIKSALIINTNQYTIETDKNIVSYQIDSATKAEVTPSTSTIMQETFIDGSYNITVTDEVGNTTMFTLVVDTTPLSISSPLITNLGDPVETTVDYTVTTSENFIAHKIVRVAYDSTTEGEYTIGLQPTEFTTVPATNSLQIITIPDAGNTYAYKYEISFKDEAGNITKEELIIDKRALTIVSTDVTTNSDYYVETIVDFVAYKINEQEWITVTATKRYQVMTGLKDHDKDNIVKVKDAAGNIASITVYTDLEGPTVTNTLPATIEIDEMNGIDFKAYFTITDYDVKTDTNKTVPVTDAMITNDLTDPLVLGRYTVTLTVSDEYGNKTIEEVEVTAVDTTAPIVTSVDTDEDGNLTSEKRTTSNTYTLEANEELIEYRVYLEGDTPPEFTTASTPSTIITDILYEVVDGIYVIEVKDKAANTTSIKVYVGVNSAVIKSALIINTNQYTIETDKNIVSYQIDSATKVEVTPSTSTVMQETFIDGSYNITVTDEVGNPTMFTLVVDTTPLSISSPLITNLGDPVETTVDYKVTTSENFIAHKIVRVAYDSTTEGEYTIGLQPTEFTTVPATNSLQIITIPNAGNTYAYKYEISFKDEAGNITKEELIIDKRALTIVSTDVTTNSDYYVETIVDFVAYKINEQEWITVTATKRYQVMTGLTEHDKDNIVKVKDATGNIASITVYTDFEGPTVTNTLPATIEIDGMNGIDFKSYFTITDYDVKTDTNNAVTVTDAMITNDLTDPLALGSYTITLTVSDEYGNKTIEEVVVTVVDTKAPIVTSVDTDEDGNLTSEKRTTSNTYTLVANEELIEYRVYLEGDTPPAFTPLLTPDTTIPKILDEVGDGIYVIEVKDKATNTTSIKVYVGVNSAVIKSALIINTNQYTIETDKNIVSYQIDSATKVEVTPSTSTVMQETFIEGSYDITVTDEVGNTTMFTLVVDTTPLSISSPLITNLGDPVETTVDYTVTTSENFIAYKIVRVDYDSTTEGVYPIGLQPTEFTTDTATNSLQIITIPDAGNTYAYKYEISFKDEAGNITEEELIIDKRALTILSSDVTTNSDYYVETIVDFVAYKINEQEWITVTATKRYQVMTGLKDHDKDNIVKVKDAAGNIASITVYTDLEGPTVTNTLPATIEIDEMNGIDFKAYFTITDYDVKTDTNKTVPVTDAMITNDLTDPLVLGRYTITLTVSDEYGNKTIEEVEVTAVDTTAPIVTSVDTDEDGNLTSEKRTTSNTYTLEANEELIEYRVYLEGDTPPAFTTASTPSTIITDILYEVVDGIYVIEVKDKAANTTSIKVYVGVNSAVIKSALIINTNQYTIETDKNIVSYQIDSATKVEVTPSTSTVMQETFIDGSYNITVTDEVGNPTMFTLVVDIPSPPSGGNGGGGSGSSRKVTISLEGPTTITLELGTVYSELGYTATAADKTTDITSNVEVDSNVVENEVGTYTIVYTIRDNDGIKTATRTVKVVDTVGPQITLNGSTITYVALNGVYDELGVTVFDYSQTETVIISGTINTNAEGTYTVTYKVRDIVGNESTATRTVIVASSTTKNITIEIGSGAQEIIKEINSPLLGLEETEIMYLISELEPTIDSNWLTESEVVEIIPTKENSYLYILLKAKNGAYEIQQLEKLNSYKQIEIGNNNQFSPVEKDKWIYDENLIGTYKNSGNSIIEFNNNSEISYQNVTVHYQVVENSNTNGLSIIPSVKAIELTKVELTKGEKFKVKLDSGQALKYYVEVEDTEVINSQTYYLSIDANDNVIITAEANSNKLLLIVGIISAVPMIGAAGFYVVKKRYL